MTRHEEAVARLRARIDSNESELREKARVLAAAQSEHDNIQHQVWALSDAEQAERNARCTEPGCSLCAAKAAGKGGGQ